jgi:hypothetical protein
MLVEEREGTLVVGAGVKLFRLWIHGRNGCDGEQQPRGDSARNPLKSFTH